MKQEAESEECGGFIEVLPNFSEGDQDVRSGMLSKVLVCVERCRESLSELKYTIF